MIEYIKNNFYWIGPVIVPILITIIGGVFHLCKKSGRNQKIGNINGSGNTIINGDVTEHTQKKK